jgi:hypothetical protein
MSAQDVDNQTGGFVPKYYQDGCDYKEIERDEAISAALDGKYQFLSGFKPYTGERLSSEIPPCGEMKVGVYDTDQEHIRPKPCDMTKFLPSGNGHYKKHPSGVECIEIVQHYNFNIGNIIKYAWRLGHKDDAISELEKIINYAKFEKQRIEKMTVEGRQNYTPYVG